MHMHTFEKAIAELKAESQFLQVLKPYSLEAVESAFCLAGDEERTRKVFGVKTVYTACRDEGMPFPVMVACIGNPDDERSQTDETVDPSNVFLKIQPLTCTVVLYMPLLHGIFYLGSFRGSLAMSRVV